LSLWKSVDKALQQAEQQTTHICAEDKQTMNKEATNKALSETLGFTASRHKDWIDDQDIEAQVLLNDVLHTPSLDQRQELHGQEVCVHSR